MDEEVLSFIRLRMLTLNRPKEANVSFILYFVKINFNYPEVSKSCRFPRNDISFFSESCSMPSKCLMQLRTSLKSVAFPRLQYLLVSAVSKMFTLLWRGHSLR